MKTKYLVILIICIAIVGYFWWLSRVGKYVADHPEILKAALL
jgi:hypothetical protein